MIVVLGATGHVGSAVATALLRAGAPVTVVTRDEGKAAGWRDRGAEAAVIDVGDADALRALFALSRRAFLLNPPAPVSGDTDREEHRTAASIARAVQGSRLEKIVAESTYGAQPGEAVGDLSTLYDFEQALFAQPIPATALRAAYYMSNWDAMLDAARQGTLPSMIPADTVMPMVAPADLGEAAARLLLTPPTASGVHHVEGPSRHTPADVAAAFGAALGREVRVVVTPREGWVAQYRSLGFSEEAAQSYARMTAVSVDGGFDLPPDPERGPTTLASYIDGLVKRRADSEGQPPA